MKIVKILVILVLIIVLLVVAAGAFLMIRIDAFAKSGIERGATYSLGVPTTLDSADVGVFSGKFGMSGLGVTNPEGFEADHFLALGEGGVKVSYASLQDDTVKLPLLTLSDIDLSLERSKGKSNYGVILDNLKKFESDSPAEPKPEQEGGKTFVIEKLLVENVNVHVNLLPEAGALTKRDLTIAKIELFDVGGENGVPMAELAGIVAKAILESVASLGGDLIPADILGELQGGLADLQSLGDMGIGMATGAVKDLSSQAENLAAEAQKAGEEAVDQAKEAVDDVKEEAEKAVDDLKNLLPGKKKDDP